MIYSHDEVELIDVLTLMEAVSKKAGSQITARMVADCHLAIKWFHELVDFSGKDAKRPELGLFSDWNWDGPVVMQSLEATGVGSLAHRIYMTSIGITRKTVIAWIGMHDSWKVKANG